MERKRRWGLIGLTAAVCFVMHGQERRLVPDDLLRLERIKDIAISPDGQWVAYARHRSRLSARRITWGYFGDDRSDIWYAPTHSEGTPINITKGELDDSGYWMPTWSPDSKRLAMLSTRGGDNICIWVWEQSSGRLIRLSGRSVVPRSQIVWIDNYRLAAVLLPEGQPSPLMTLRRRGAYVAAQEWTKAFSGLEVSANVLDSGVDVDINVRPKQQLVLLDMVGKEHIVASSLTVPEFHVSPNGRYLAILKQVRLGQPDPNKLLEYRGSRLSGSFQPGHDNRYQITVANLDGHAVAEPKAFAVPASFRWSKDGLMFAFLGVYENEDGGPFRVFLGGYNLPTKSISIGELNPESLEWTRNGRLLLKVTESYKGKGTNSRIDWWLLSNDGTRQDLTHDLTNPPAELLPLSDGKSFAGIADGELWRLDTESGELTNLTSSLDGKVAALASPAACSEAKSFGISSVVISVYTNAIADYYAVQMATGAKKHLQRPSGHAELAGYCSVTGSAIFVANEPTGTYLTIVQSAAKRSLAETNTFLREIRGGKRQLVHYRSLDGENLDAWLILPPEYKTGRRYPMIVWVYPGYLAGEEPPPLTQINDDEEGQNLQLLAAAGYVVLWPSMPLRSHRDDYMELTKAVVPALDKVVDLGVADPDRLTIIGYSYGGYGTYGLITQTNRFKAAISVAGISDLISLYGTFLPQWRYEPFPHELLSEQAHAETGQQRMGNPPWNDWARYLRNSPIFYVDRVQTPVLIVQGDMDSVSMTQGEEFFTALFRQRKRARFLRYWGESHVLYSPANIRNFWTQVYAWIDEFSDISRDRGGNIVFDGDHVKSRNGTSALRPEDFAKFNKMVLNAAQTQ